MSMVLAVDIGGTKMLAARVDALGQCAAVCEAPTPAAAGADAVISAARALLQRAAEGQQPVAIGVSAAGVIDPQSACVRDATDALPGWKGTDLRAALQADGAVPVHALNDVHAALLGEAWVGALQDRPRGAMLTLGTGLGGAWMTDGRLQTGAHGLAGHWGRTRVQHRGDWVPLEALVSGQGLAYWHRLHGGTARNGREVLATDPAQLALQAALRDWTQHLAYVLHNIHWTLDPGLVLLGGGLITARERWWPQLMVALGDLPLTVQPAALGAQAGLVGAARWAWQQVGAA